MTEGIMIDKIVLYLLNIYMLKNWYTALTCILNYPIIELPVHFGTLYLVGSWWIWSTITIAILIEHRKNFAVVLLWKLAWSKYNLLRDWIFGTFLHSGTCAHYNFRLWPSHRSIYSGIVYPHIWHVHYLHATKCMCSTDSYIILIY